MVAVFVRGRSHSVLRRRGVMIGGALSSDTLASSWPPPNGLERHHKRGRIRRILRRNEIASFMFRPVTRGPIANSCIRNACIRTQPGLLTCMRGK